MHDTFKVLKEKDLQPRITIQPRLLFRVKIQRKSFSDRLKEFTTTKSDLEEMLKGLKKKRKAIVEENYEKKIHWWKIAKVVDQSPKSQYEG